MIDLIKDVAEAVRATMSQQQRTSAYDTPATVKRIEDGIAWIHIPGGVDETPVKLTIAAKPGDTVQVRVGGGTAFLVGNATAPPTDDRTAKTALTTAKAASIQSAASKKNADDAIRIAGNTNQYFWHTETGTDTGAHITEKTQAEFSADPQNGGGNLLARSNGIAIRDGLNELAILTSDLARVGASDSPHVSIGTDNISLVNSDGVAWFDMDLDAGESTVTNDIRFYSRSFTGKTDHDMNDTETKTFDVSSISIGKTIRLYFQGFVFNTYSYREGYTTYRYVYLDKSSAVAVNTVASPENTYDYIEVKPASGHTSVYFTKGTASEDYEYSLSNVLIKDPNTNNIIGKLSFSWTFSYDGGNSINAVFKFKVTDKSTSTGSFFIQSVRKTATVYYSITTTGSLLTYGTRKENGTTGINSATFGIDLEACENNMVVVGQYNQSRITHDCIFEVGNGYIPTGETNPTRSTALAVTLAGDTELSLDTTAASGTDHDLYAAITALGWESEVIV